MVNTNVGLFLLALSAAVWFGWYLGSRLERANQHLHMIFGTFTSEGRDEKVCDAADMAETANEKPGVL